MAKQSKKEDTPPSPSLLDFEEENLLGNITPSLDGEEEEELVPKKGPKTKKKTTTIVEEELEEEEEEPSEEEEEEEEEPIQKPKPKVGEEEEEEEEEEEPNDAEAFFEKVTAITGTPVDVDYGETDPLSPQGVALRDKALIETAVADFVDQLKERYPAVHQALEYAHAGGDISDLFQREKDYSKVTIADEDEDHAKAVLTEYYQAKGISNEARIKRMIAADSETEEGIVKTAQAALTEMIEEQNRQKQSELADKQKEQEAQRQQDTKFLSSVTGLIKGGKLDNFKIPAQDTSGFYEYVKGRIQRDGQGGYMIITPIDQAQLEKTLQTEFFRYKKGDLSQLITIKASSLKAEGLRLKVKTPESGPKTTIKDKSSSRTLKDFEK